MVAGLARPPGDACMKVYGLHTGLQSGGHQQGLGLKDVFVGKDPRDWFKVCACLP